jgi:hypothetical protein
VEVHPVDVLHEAPAAGRKPVTIIDASPVFAAFLRGSHN